jgi:hypothetical protein
LKNKRVEYEAKTCLNEASVDQPEPTLQSNLETKEESDPTTTSNSQRQMLGT